MDLMQRQPQEARLLSIDFEETAAHQMEENERDARANKGHGSGPGSGPSSGRFNTNTGMGEWSSDEVIGDDDEIDWSEADDDDPE